MNTMLLINGIRRAYHEKMVEIGYNKLYDDYTKDDAVWKKVIRRHTKALRRLRWSEIKCYKKLGAY